MKSDGLPYVPKSATTYLQQRKRDERVASGLNQGESEESSGPVASSRLPMKLTQHPASRPLA